MRNFIEKFLGVKVVADLGNINGKKSDGVEDYSKYDYWKADEPSPIDFETGTDKLMTKILRRKGRETDYRVN